MKLLITADIHISDPSNYNYEFRTRLKNYLVLAHRLVEMGKDQGCEIISILGDLIDKPTSRPYVNSVVKDFLLILSEGFKEIHIINGNHCVDGKLNHTDVRDSLLYQYINLIPNLKYKHGQLEKIGNTSIYYKDYESKHDLSKIEGKVDLLLTHDTIAPDGSGFIGQEIDTTKFDLEIAGDIHTPYQVGNRVTVNVPIQKTMSDCPEGSVIVFDCDTKDWKRVLVDPDHSRFLRLDWTIDKNEEGFYKNGLLYKIYKPSKSKGEDQDSQVTLDKLKEIKSLAQDYMSEVGLLDIHNEIVFKLKDDSTVNFDFNLTKIIIKNFRSIEELEFNFDSDISVIVGHNGSGKSSFEKAVHIALMGVGGSEAKKLVQIGKKNFKLELSLEYMGNSYKIIRASNSVEFFQGGEPITATNKKTLEGEINRRLPFLNYLDSYIIPSSQKELLGNISSERRLELIGKFYRLSLIDDCYTTCMEITDPLNDEISSLTKDIAAKDISISDQKRLIDQTPKEVLDYKVNELIEELESIKSKVKAYEGLRSKKSKIKSSRSLLESGEEELKYLVEENRNIDLSLSSVQVDLLKEELLSVTTRLAENSPKADQKRSLSILLESTESELNRLRKDYESVSKSECPACNQKLVKGVEEKLSSLKTKGLEKSKVFSDLSKEIEGVAVLSEEELSRLKSSESSLRSSIDKCNQLEAKRSSNTSRISNLEGTNSLLRNDILEMDKSIVDMDCDYDIIELTDRSSDISRKLQERKSYDLAIDHLKVLEDEKTSLGEFKQSKSFIVERYNKYLDHTKKSGGMYKIILDDLSENFSNEDFKFSASTDVYRGKDRSDIEVSLRVRGNYIEYSNLSDGQKTLCDVYFLFRLITSGGVLMMDEFLKHLDDENIGLACEYLAKTNVNNLIITTHSDNLILQGDRVHFELSDKGVSKINLSI